MGTRLPVIQPATQQRPTSREQCRGGIRPCPFVGCADHLITNYVMGKLRFEGLGRDATDDEVVERLMEMPETCLRDVLERGESLNLESIGEILGVTRERVRQVQASAIVAMRRNLPEDMRGDMPANGFEPTGETTHRSSWLRQRALELHRDGRVRISEIADQLETELGRRPTNATIKRWLGIKGLKRSTPEIRERARALRAEGHTLDAVAQTISEELGHTPALRTVSIWCKGITAGEAHA